eukprot:172323_1
MAPCFVVLCMKILQLHAITNLPFSWDKPPIFAFPGAHDGFITQQEINLYNYTQFQQFNIWGFNVSCQAPNGTIYPAPTPSSRYECPNNSFYPNLETALQYQSHQLKQMLSTNLSIFPYIIFTSAQQSYVYQNIFNSPQHSDWHLTLTNAGTINCFNASYHCEYQGPSEYQYDFRQTAVQNYFINNILMSITNSSFVNGLFLDEVDNWICIWCNSWHCTPQEISDISDAIVNTLNNMFAAYKKAYGSSKVFSISLKSNLNSYSDLYWRIRGILEKYNDIAIRYYEGFQAADKFMTYFNETNYGIGGLAQQVHSYAKTLNPDFVEFAAFLIGANNQSWFSYSYGWTVNSGWYQPEYDNKLGKPLAPGNCSFDNKWYIYNDTNNIYGKVQPKCNSTDGTVIYIGVFNDYNSCFDAVKSYKYGEFGSFTWVNNAGGNYALQCFGRIGDTWNTVKQNTTVSGHLGAMLCTRSFEYCDVVLDVDNYGATLNWK